MCRGYFYSQEIDPHHATEHRSTDQSRNGCGMCCFRHAQPFEITRAKNIKNPLVQRSCQNAKVVQAFCSRRVHHRDRHQHTILIALAALPGATLPRLRALALFGRRSPQRVDSLVMPASENLHRLGHRQRSGTWFIPAIPRGGGLQNTFREIPVSGRGRGRTPDARYETPDRWSAIVSLFPERRLLGRQRRRLR